MNPLVALGRNGSLGLSGFVNKFNADAELLDDLVCLSFGGGCVYFTDPNARMTIGQRSPTRFVIPSQIATFEGSDIPSTEGAQLVD